MNYPNSTRRYGDIRMFFSISSAGFFFVSFRWNAETPSYRLGLENILYIVAFRSLHREKDNDSYFYPVPFIKPKL